MAGNTEAAVGTTEAGAGTMEAAAGNMEVVAGTMEVAAGTMEAVAEEDTADTVTADTGAAGIRGRRLILRRRRSLNLTNNKSQLFDHPMQLYIRTTLGFDR
ncbi:unnamed protein product [Cuscuta campestris]|uniref:Uncharacterized protein n=1 Tax=Cuscuta campestris TaxID=132261 RepID=A0A484KJE8_9ASTE|nr:unnamed protein product [Cuscuta campestris]